MTTVIQWGHTLKLLFSWAKWRQTLWMLRWMTPSFLEREMHHQAWPCKAEDGCRSPGNLSSSTVGSRQVLQIANDTWCLPCAIRLWGCLKNFDCTNEVVYHHSRHHTHYLRGTPEFCSEPIGLPCELFLWHEFPWYPLMCILMYTVRFQFLLLKPPMLVCCTWDLFLSRDRKHWTWPATSHHGPRVQGSRWPSCPNDLEKRQKGGDGRHWKRGDVPMFVAILIGIWSTMKFRATLFSDKPLRHWRPSDVCRIGFNQQTF